VDWQKLCKIKAIKMIETVDSSSCVVPSSVFHTKFFQCPLKEMDDRSYAIAAASSAVSNVPSQFLFLGHD